MAALLDVFPSRLDPISLRQAIDLGWRSVGGPVDEVIDLINAAAAAGLLDVSDDAVGRTPGGSRARRRRRDGDRSAVGVALLQAGLMADQARRLVECAVLDSASDLFKCPRTLRREAPQLLAILELEEQIYVGQEIALSRRVYELVSAVWVFMEPSEQMPDWLDDRRRVGHMAELFTWNKERSAAPDPSKVSWVSRDDDSLGYDIEDLNPNPSRCIEVKGSRGHDIQFVMSRNEMKRARQLGARYEIHFWGGLDLGAEASTHYTSLVGSGYPIVIVDPVPEFDVGEWELEPDGWRIRRLSPQD